MFLEVENADRVVRLREEVRGETGGCFTREAGVELLRNDLELSWGKRQDESKERNLYDQPPLPP